jgi:hypothetical protein
MTKNLPKTVAKALLLDSSVKPRKASIQIKARQDTANWITIPNSTHAFFIGKINSGSLLLPDLTYTFS